MTDRRHRRRPTRRSPYVNPTTPEIPSWMRELETIAFGAFIAAMIIVVVVIISLAW